MNNNRTFMDVL